MKKSKTLRDLQQRNPSPITLGDAQSESKKKFTTQDILDLSKIDRKSKSSPVLTGQTAAKRRWRPPQAGIAKKFLDITKKNTEDTKPDKFMFVEVDDKKSRAPQRVTETIKIAAAGTLILFLINVVNIYQRGMTIKNDVIATASSGYENLLHASNQSKQAQFGDAGNSFSASTKNFDDALTTLKFLTNNQGAFFTREKTLESAKNLLEAGKNISEAGTDFARGIQHLQDLPGLFLQNNLVKNLEKAKVQPANTFAGQTDAAIEPLSTPKISLTDTLQKDLDFLHEASAKISAASQNLTHVSDDVLPETMKPKLTKARDTIKNLQKILTKTEQKIPVVMKMLGQRYLHRYLILLQNDAEARPTGGFIGSYLLVDVSAGKITKTEFHDVYETDGQLKEDIPAPEDIAAIAHQWRMRDSNYSPDFAISAEKAAWFLQKEKGPSVDSVIAVNQSFIQKLFDITGPVKLEGLQSSLTKENYQTIISYLVETKTSGKDDPKKILRSFIPAFQKQLSASQDPGKILKLVIEALKDHAILLYSRDADIQNLFDEMKFSGRVIRNKPNEDFLQIITTSIGGNKSDLYMQQSITHNTLIAADGKVTDEVTLQRKHTWTTAELKRWKTILKDFGYSELSGTIQNILGSGINKSSIKMYVPKGATLIDAVGIPMENIKLRGDDEIQKTYFMFKMDIAPGEEKSITLTYELPEKLNITAGDTYRFFAQRQPGIVLSTLEKNLIVKQGVKIYESFPLSLILTEKNQAAQKSTLQNDSYMAALVGPE